MNATVPLVMCAGGDGIRRVRVIAVTVLPDPLSPTIPSTSPGATARSMSSMIGRSRSGVRTSTDSESTASRSGEPSTATAGVAGRGVGSTTGLPCLLAGALSRLTCVMTRMPRVAAARSPIPSTSRNESPSTLKAKAVIVIAIAEGSTPSGCGMMKL